MARLIETITGLEALTFDDVLLQPGHSEVMPGQTNIATRIAADIELNLPILSAAMDTVTEARLAIAMAQAGGMGVIHKNLDIARQAGPLHGHDLYVVLLAGFRRQRHLLAALRRLLYRGGGGLLLGAQPAQKQRGSRDHEDWQDTTQTVF